MMDGQVKRGGGERGGRGGSVGGRMVHLIQNPRGCHQIKRAGKCLHCLNVKKFLGCVWKNQQRQHDD